MAKYRKMPVVVEVETWDGTEADANRIIEWMGGADYGLACTPWEITELWIHTLEGALKAAAGDKIIRGVQGEFYPCKPDIFAATYEPVEDGGQRRDG